MATNYTICSIKEDKGMVIFHLAETEKAYLYDLNNRMMIGLKGLPIKSTPACLQCIRDIVDNSELKLSTKYFLVTRFVYRNSFSDVKTYLTWLDMFESYCKLYGLSNIFEIYKDYNHILTLKTHLSSLLRLTKDDDTKEINFLIKTFVEKIKAEPIDRNNYYNTMEQIAIDMCESYSAEKFLKDIPKERVTLLKERFGDNFTKIISTIATRTLANDFVLKDLATYYLTKDCAFYFNSYLRYDNFHKQCGKTYEEYIGKTDISRYMSLIKSYRDMCANLNMTPKKEKSFATEYEKALVLWLGQREKIEIETLRRNQNLDYLFFETDDYITVIPTIEKEFSDEARQQNNCVRRIYLQEVIDNYTNIVFIRAKNNLEKSLITCEVDKKGNIVQYLAKNNNRNYPLELKEFKELYEQHLAECFKK